MKKNLLSACAVVLAAATMLTFFSPIAKAQAVSSAYRQFADQACEANSFSLYDDYAPSAIVPDYPTPGGGFYAPNGGTLELTRISDMNPWGDTMYTSIVYLSRAETQGFQTLYNSPKSADEIRDWFINATIVQPGIAYFSKALATELVEFLELSGGVGIFAGLIGLSLNFLILALSNLSRWNFNDAINSSSTGKLKIEYFSLVSPYNYQSIMRFEAWNSDFIHVPSGYSYTWHPDVYANV